MSDGLSLRERALGAYLGLAVGDALGATVEFMTPREIAHAHGVHEHMIGGGWLNLSPGAVTDDTQMSLALGQAIVGAGRFDMKSVAEAFSDWLRSRPIDCGHTCRRGIRRYMLHGTLESPANEGDAGNGALMRNLPVVLCSIGDPALMARRTLAQCRFTHNHPYSDAASICFGNMVLSLLGGAAVADVMKCAYALVQEHPAFAFDGYRGPATAYVVDTVRTVLRAFEDHDSFESILIATVNRGDDADTTGALAGMLAGARFGWRAIPARWLKRLAQPVRAHIERQVPALLALAPGLLSSVPDEQPTG